MVKRRNFLLAAGLGLAAASGSSRAEQDDMTPADTPQPSRNGIALALGGGAAKAFAHIPFLETLDDMGIRPQQIAGTSMGSIIGALYCGGMSGRGIREFALETFSGGPSLFKRLLLDTGDNWSSLFNLFRPAVIEPEVLLKSLLPEGFPDRFSDLDIPLKVVATDFYGQSQKIMSEGPLLPAIAASSALPVLLTPVRVDGRVLIDGGFVNPTPFDILDSSRYATIGIDVTGSDDEDTGEIPSSMDTWTGSMSITQHSIVLEKLQTSQPDLFIAPPVGQFETMDFFEIEAILAAASEQQDVFRQGVESILQNQP
ncbi:patatin-like phospholipase family protein [Martelella mediterranea]|uniref:NTE family protein n=1 Tax=Martelella mediterranea TaxID=293089 RepID=A0A4R3P203_9HYPH|nr:patatin-like phospholipase family protein [Martelella mediterranea]TCT40904.1 NTE family protein [Martelella mediterranea]